MKKVKLKECICEMVDKFICVVVECVLCKVFMFEVLYYVWEVFFVCFFYSEIED